MKKLMLVILTLLILGVAVGPLVAQGQGGVKPPKKVQKAAPGAWAHKTETISGTISVVDPAKKTVALTANGVAYSFKVVGTKITVGGKKTKLGDLQTGAQASVVFLASRTGDTAKSIEVPPSGTPAVK